LNIFHAFNIPLSAKPPQDLLLDNYLSRFCGNQTRIFTQADFFILMRLVNKLMLYA